MFKDNLESIAVDLSKYSNIDREQFFTECINYKLTYTLQKYNEEIDYNSSQLVKSGSARVLKALTKMQKREDIKNLKESQEEQGEEFYYD